MQKHNMRLTLLVALVALITKNTWRMFCVFALFVSAVSTSADETSVSNIGFMENPPMELKTKFPMCDAFLKVEWIDKKKKIGYSNYEAIMKTKDGQFKDRRKVRALVDLDVFRIDYDVYQYKREGRLEEIFDMIRNGRVQVGIPMMIDYKGEIISLYAGGAVNYDASHPLLSDHRQTICVPYPDGLLAWVVEGKEVRQTYNEKQVDDLAKQIEGVRGNEVPRKRIEALWMLDINFDGKSDFLFEQSFFYSMPDRIYAMGRVLKHPNFEFIFPPGNSTCLLKMAISYPLITDGMNYYFKSINNQCNLTELTSGR